MFSVVCPYTFSPLTQCPKQSYLNFNLIFQHFCEGSTKLNTKEDGNLGHLWLDRLKKLVWDSSLWIARRIEEGGQRFKSLDNTLHSFCMKTIWNILANDSFLWFIREIDISLLTLLKICLQYLLLLRLGRQFGFVSKNL